MKKILYLIVFFSFSITHAHESGGSEVVPCSVKYSSDGNKGYEYSRRVFLSPSMTFIGAHFSVPDNGRDIAIPVIVYYGKKNYQFNGAYYVKREKGNENPVPTYTSAAGGIWELITEKDFKRKLKPDYCEIIY
jgi:hypothetical protein